VRILIVDDHALFRRGLKDLLEESFMSAVIGEAGTAQEALESVRRKKWDVVLLDISLPGRSGLDALLEVKSAAASLPVIVLSAHREDQYALRVLKAGASGYIEKGNAPNVVVDAIRKVCSGATYVSSTLAEKLARDMIGGGAEARHDNLSPREFEILRLIAAGKSSKEIATDLSISIQTVSTHRARVLEKLRLHTTAEMIRYAMEHRLVE
jgi:two-component system, NarL family, invasion response regulator UvrY